MSYEDYMKHLCDWNYQMIAIYQMRMSLENTKREIEEEIKKLEEEA